MFFTPLLVLVAFIIVWYISEQLLVPFLTSIDQTEDAFIMFRLIYLQEQIG